MPVQLEASFKGRVRKWARGNGFMVMAIQTIVNVGWPDDVFVAPSGDIIWIEAKRGTKERTPIQDHVCRQLAARKQRVYTSRSYAESIAILRKYVG